MEKERISIITWKNIIKLALGIMLGLAPAIYIMKSSTEIEVEPVIFQSKTEKT